MSNLAVDLRSVVAFVDHFPVLSGVDFQVDAGSCVLLTGPNGAGKTSLLRVLAGLLGVHQGQGSVLGHDLTCDLHSLRREVGFLGHESFLYGDLTVRENLEFSARATKSIEAVDAVMQRLGLVGRLEAVTVDRLSAGQRRRAALGALLARRPRLLLLDEPQASLDKSSREVLSSVLAEARDQGRTVIFSSHENDHGGIAIDRHVEVMGGAVDGLLEVASDVA